MTHPCAGKFIVFDGPDGCGKTTQRDRLAKHLKAAGTTIVTCKDPGGSVIGDRIRHILLDFDLSTMDVRCETLLFMASRAQLVGEVIGPALAAGHTVLCDRYVSATCAYQVAAGADIARVLALAPFAIDTTWPDLTFVLDVDTELGLERAGRKSHQAGKNRKGNGQQSMFSDAVIDAMEARPIAFHRKVRQAFLDLPQSYPHPVRIVDANRDADAVHDDIRRIVGEVFG